MYLIERALLSSSHPPSVVASTIAVIDVLEKEPQHVKTLEKHKLFQKAVDDLGFDTNMSQTPIIPIIVGESHIAKMLANKLYEKNIFVVPIVFSMVASNKWRIRVQISAKLNKELLDEVISKNGNDW